MSVDLYVCLGRWFVVIDIHMGAGIQGFTSRVLHIGGQLACILHAPEVSSNYSLFGLGILSR